MHQAAVRFPRDVIPPPAASTDRVGGWRDQSPPLRPSSTTPIGRAAPARHFVTARRHLPPFRVEHLKRLVLLNI
jgi:hypothetical protein